MDSLIPQAKSIDNSMNPSRIFILRPIATSLLMVALLLSGLFAYRLLPISSLPQVDYPTIQVATFYPGASPEVMTSAITAPLERQFGQMPGLEQMSSISSSGASMITLQFSLDLALDVAEQDVQAAINAATSYLPNDLPSPPVYNKVNPADTPIVTFAITSDTLPLAQVEDFADTKLSQKIAQLPGVGLVSISGGQRPAVRIKVNPTALAAYGLTLENIRSIVAANNVNMPKGSFDGSRQSYTINTNDQLLSSVDYRSIIVAYKNNAPIRLSDVATVNDDIENVNQAAWANTKPAIILNIQRQPGANVIQIADSVKSLFTKLRATLPRAMKISLLTDRTITIRASVKDVQFELMLAVVLVVTVIFLFLRNLPATIIPSVSVPLSLIGTFGVMYFCGFSLNNLTLMGLTIATGFVVDDAIVMIENISRYIEQGVPPMQAALKGAAQIGFTIMSLTVALIAALIPLLFMTDVIGMLFREFAITVAVTILLSAVVSLTLTPMLCSRILRLRTEAEMSAFERRSAAILHKLINHYQTSLQWVLKHQRQTLWVALLTLTASCLLFYFIPKGFFPVQDTGLIQGISEAKQTTSFSAMAERQQALAKVILADPGVANLSSFIGIDGVNNTLNSGRMLITLKPLEQRKDIASDIIQRLQTKLAQVAGITLYMQPVQDLTLDDRVTRTQYQYSLSTSNATVLAHWTTLLVDKLHTAPQLLDVTSDQQNYGLETTINIDRDTASRLGISPQLIDDTLYDAFGQRQISTMFTQSNQYHVVLETMVPPENVNPLDNIYFNTTTGTVIPLKAFAQITHTIAPLLVTRQDQFPASIISFNLSSGTALSVAPKIIQHAQQAIGIPDNVVTSFEGAAKIFQNSLNNELWLVIAAIIVIYIMLGVLYESYIHPITILSTLPSACLGAVLALFLCGTELSVIALIGVILLIGIVMKNAIMMIDFALEQERRYHKTAHDAIYEACILRFRPILMTTMASLLGAVPIAFSLGIGSELRRPLGIAIIGGLIVSQVLTLYTTPVIYLAFDRIAKKLAPTFNNNHDDNGEEQ